MSTVELDNLRERNAQTPILSLPDHVLELILLLNARPESSESPLCTTTRVSQTCHRLRLVALDYPFLWSRLIDFYGHKPQQNVELLNRSRTCPIDMTPSPRPLNETSFSLLRKHAPRLRILNLQIYAKRYEALSDLLAAAPLLESVSITSPENDFAALHTVVRGSIFSSLPHLSELTIDRYGFDLDVPQALASKLTKLHLSFPDSIPAIPVSSWLHALSNMGSLRKLILHNCIGKLPESHPSPSSLCLPVIQLPHIRVLVVSCPLEAFSILSDHLPLHHLSVFNFTLKDVHTGPALSVILQRTNEVLESLQPTINGKDAPPSQTIIKLSADQFETRSRTKDKDQDDLPHFQMCFKSDLPKASMAIDPGMLSCATEAISTISVIPTSKKLSLIFDWDTYSSSTIEKTTPFFNNLFSSLTNVNRLSLGGSPMGISDCLGCLQIAPSKDSSANSEGYLPQLTDLEIKNINVSEYSGAFRNLFDFLRLRRRMGLHRLKVRLPLNSR